MNRTSAVIFFLFLTVSFSHAEVITDGTLHKEGKQFNLPSSPYYNITADTGQQKGSNLFHSFLHFNIMEGETAVFSGPENISNIISRVTGGSSSLIDGWIYSTIPGADFYFLNPSGIIFGPNAYLNIPGSFHFSTADYLKLGEDGRFDAMTPENSLLTMSPPSAFGFINDSPSPISVQNSFAGHVAAPGQYIKTENDVFFIPSEKETISLIGGDIEIENSVFHSENGNIRIASVASPGELPVTGSPDISAFEKYGDITLSRGSKLLSGQDGGSSSGIFIQGGNFYLKDEGTTVFSANSSLEGGDIDIHLSGSLSLENTASVTTGTTGERDAGNIRIHSQNIAVGGGGKIHSESSGTGNSGGIDLRSDDTVSVSNGGEIFTYTEGQGAAGNISASAVNLNVTDGGKIYSYGSGNLDFSLSGFMNVTGGGQVSMESNGYEGDIGIHAQNLSVTDSAFIANNSGGDIHVGLGGGMSVSNQGAVATNSGDITVNAGYAETFNGGTLDTGSTGSRSGSITVNARSVNLSGSGGLLAVGEGGYTDAGDIDISAGTLRVSDNARISTASAGNGHGGNVLIRAGNFYLDNNGITESTAYGNGDAGNIRLETQADTRIFGSGSGLYADAKGSGNAGEISVYSELLNIWDGGLIRSLSYGSGSSGNISIQAKQTEITSGGNINSSSLGSGNSGSISVKSETDFQISGTGSGLFSEAAGDGNAGDISVHSGKISISDQGKISTASFGNGSSGMIASEAEQLEINGGILSSSSYGEGNSGNVTVEAEQLEINGGILSSSSYGGGNSGNVTVEAEQLDINGILDTSSYGNGSSGDLSLIADIIRFSGSNSGLYASSHLSGNAGNIAIASEELTLSDNAVISGRAIGEGDGADIVLELSRLTLEKGGRIAAGTSGSGNSGNISVKAGESVFISGTGSGMYNTGAENSSGNAGNIRIRTDSLTLADNGVISGETEGTGRGGDVIIGGKDINISGGKITTTTRDAGDGGNICISARDSLRISGEGNPENGLIANAASGSSGKGGSIRIFTETLTAEDSASLAAQTFGSGPGGSITANAGQMNIRSNAYISTAGGGTSDGGEIRLTARDSIEISDSAEAGSMTEGSGNAGNIHLSSHSLLVSDEGRISSGTKGKGDAGDIRINADEVEVRKGHILSATENADSGNAGDIFIAADSLSVSGSGLREELPLPCGIHAKSQGAGRGGDIHISARLLDVFSDGWISSQTDGGGRGGDIFAEVNRLNVHEGGTLTTSTRGAGNSGNISVSAKESVNVSGAGSNMEKSSIYTATHSAGAGGILSIRTPFLRVGEDGELFADTLGDETLDGNTLADGPAGDIFLYTDFLELTDGALISAGTRSEESGGNISVYAEKGVHISGSAEKKSGIYALSESRGKGGNITLETLPLKIEKGGEISTSAANAGSAGTIDLKIRDLELAGSIGSHSSGEGKAGNIRIDASEHIISEGGEISTASEKSQGGSISINTPFLSALENSRITAAVSGGDKDGGQVDIRSERIVFTGGSRAESSTAGKGSGGEISIYASDSLYLAGQGEENTGIFSTSGAEGDAGRISVRSPFLLIEDHAEISTESAGSGKAGDIVLEENIRQLSLRSNGEISSANLSDGDGGSISIRTEESVTLENSFVSTESAEGKGGRIRIFSPLLEALENSRISAGVSGGEKAGGSIEIGTEKFELGSGSRMESSTRGKGEGGTVTVNAADSLRLIGNGEKNTGIFSTAGAEGNAGQITVRTPDIFITDNAEISTESTGTGKAGDISVTQDIERIEIRNRGTLSSANRADGDAGSIFLSPAEYLFLENAFVTTEAAEGKGGEIRISTPLLRAGENSRISAGVSAGMKEGGRIDIHTQNMEFTGGARAESSTGGEGRGGTITITASDSLYLSGKGEMSSGIFSMTDHKGSAGQIRIQSPEFIMDDTAAVSTDTSGSGTGGNMDIAAENLRMEGESSLSSRSTGDGNAGDITVRISDEVHMNNSSVTTEARQADGGNIRFLAEGRVNLTDSDITASVGGGEGNGGNIEMDYGMAILDHSRIIAKAEGGSGGNIQFIGDHFIRSGDSVIDASSRFGIDGSVNFSSPEADISGNLAVFPENFLMASQWLQTPCRNKSLEDVSRFLLSGRDGIPALPDDWLAGPIFPLETKEEPEPGIFRKARHFLSAGDFRNLLKESEKIAAAKNISGKNYVQAMLYQIWAYQSLGFHRKALSLLQQTAEPGESGMNAMILSIMGDLHLCLGNTAEAGKFLKKAMQAAEKGSNSLIRASVLNHTGNYLAVCKDQSGAMSAYGNALELLETGKEGDTPLLRSVLLLNLARLALEYDNVTEAVRWLEKSESHIMNLPTGFEKAFYLLSFSALSLDIRQKYPGIRPPLKEMTASALQQCLALAEKLSNPRLASYVLGYMGRYYEMQKEYDSALRLTRRAVFRAGEANCPEILYAWHWQSGRLFQAQGDSEKAMDAYNSAISELTPLRAEFYTGFRRKKEIFNKKFRPLYLD
ncbi:MAG: filamentous hemagglutinin N-terminal domain-containing protein, partial [Desulfococcaceae bacterium]|nr:filamentous hemagglutinin N-terminal domain-containing protein [Desulfococcaceae bacterium]